MDENVERLMTDQSVIYPYALKNFKAHLESGGAISISITANPFKMPQKDREFFTRVISDHLQRGLNGTYGPAPIVPIVGNRARIEKVDKMSTAGYRPPYLKEADLKALVMQAISGSTGAQIETFHARFDHLERGISLDAVDLRSKTQ